MLHQVGLTEGYTVHHVHAAVFRWVLIALMIAGLVYAAMEALDAMRAIRAVQTAVLV